MKKPILKGRTRLDGSAVFSEPGAVNSLGEYKRWLHVWGRDWHNNMEVYPGVYPWPFEERVIDAEKLAAWGAIGRYHNFPGSWPLFINHWGRLTLVAEANQTAVKLYWKLANGVGPQHLDRLRKLAVPPISLIKFELPEVMIKCICSIS